MGFSRVQLTVKTAQAREAFYNETHVRFLFCFTCIESFFYPSII